MENFRFAIEKTREAESALVLAGQQLHNLRIDDAEEARHTCVAMRKHYNWLRRQASKVEDGPVYHHAALAIVALNRGLPYLRAMECCIRDIKGTLRLIAEMFCFSLEGAASKADHVMGLFKHVDIIFTEFQEFKKNAIELESLAGKLYAGSDPV